MFWGLIMEPERRYTQKVKKSFHVSMAALDLATSQDQPCQVMCGYEGRNYLLCTLKRPDVLQCSLDLEFAAGSEVSFASNGGSHIHLTGYLTDVDEDDDGFNLADLEEQDEEEIEEQEEVEVLKGKKKKNKTKEKNEPPPKKAKLVNGSANEDIEEESDDPDFEAVKEELDSSLDDEESEEEVDSDELLAEEEGSDDEEEQEVKAPVSKKEKKNAKQNADAGAKKSKKTEEPQKKQRNLKDGVIVEDLTEGNGPPAKLGRFVNVYYEGRLQKTNRMFDSTTKGPGFKFRLGAGEVIKAWDIGLVGMKVGGVRKIICPPQTAYGAKGSPPAIPPNSTLVFTVTLKKIN